MVYVRCLLRYSYAPCARKEAAILADSRSWASPRRQPSGPRRCSKRAKKKKQEKKGGEGDAKNAVLAMRRKMRELRKKFARALQMNESAPDLEKMERAEVLPALQTMSGFAYAFPCA